MFPPDLPLVGTGTFDPDMPDPGGGQGFMKALPGRIAAIFRPAAQPKQANAPVGGSRISEDAAEGSLWIEVPPSAAESGDGIEEAKVSEPDLQSLACAHRKAGNGAVIAVGYGAVVRVN